METIESLLNASEEEAKNVLGGVTASNVAEPSDNITEAASVILSKQGDERIAESRKGTVKTVLFAHAPATERYVAANKSVGKGESIGVDGTLSENWVKGTWAKLKTRIDNKEVQIEDADAYKTFVSTVEACIAQKDKKVRTNLKYNRPSFAGFEVTSTVTGAKPIMKRADLIRHLVDHTAGVFNVAAGENAQVKLRAKKLKALAKATKAGTKSNVYPATYVIANLNTIEYGGVATDVCYEPTTSVIPGSATSELCFKYKDGEKTRTCRMSLVVEKYDEELKKQYEELYPAPIKASDVVDISDAEALNKSIQALAPILANSLANNLVNSPLTEAVRVKASNMEEARLAEARALAE